MRTIELQGIVAPDGTLTVRLPSDVPPGEHRMVLVIDERPVQRPHTPLKLNVGKLAGWPPDATYRREELYGDDGR